MTHNPPSLPPPTRPTSPEATPGPNPPPPSGWPPRSMTCARAAGTVGSYAHVVRDRAYARRAIETGARLAQTGYTAADNGAEPNLRAAVLAECATAGVACDPSTSTDAANHPAG